MVAEGTGSQLFRLPDRTGSWVVVTPARGPVWAGLFILGCSPLGTDRLFFFFFFVQGEKTVPLGDGVIYVDNLKGVSKLCGMREAA